MLLFGGTPSRGLVGSFAIAWAALACGPAEDDGTRYRAEIRWTSFGIPHIEADDIPSALYGQGYAFAQDAGCILADQIVKVRSERSRYFGPGEDGANLDSDFLHLTLGIMERGRAGFAAQSPEIQEMVTAYADGYNRYIVDHAATLPCGGEPWVAPIEPEDLFAHYVELGTLASARALAPFIASAQPPGSRLERHPPQPTLEELRSHKPGSNGWAIGRDRSLGGGGMLLANPHFPWQGELKLWESHLRVPGELDVYGVGLMGVAGMLIGFNDAVAWTHTVSNGQRFTFYSLTLDPADPTRYKFGDDWRAMESRAFTIDVRQDDGTLAPQSRTMWSSHYGPMLDVPPFGWSADLAFTYRDANLENTALIAQFFAMNRSRSMAEFQAAHAEHQGIPWVNTISTSADGEAWYADTTPTPNLAPEILETWLEESLPGGDFLVSSLAANGVVLLDGDDPAAAWVDAPGAREPGLVPYAEVPKLTRTDFVFNANDSHWLTNPAAPLEGFSAMHGFERVPRTPRTRMNAVTLTESGPGSSSGDDGRFDLAELQAAALSNRGLMAELVRDALVQRCDGTTTVAYQDPVSQTTRDVDITAVCAAIANWDLRLDPASKGALAFREFLASYPYVALINEGIMFDVGFDPDDPVATPNTLAAADPAEDFALQALAGAATRLAAAGIAPDAEVSAFQFTKKADKRIPVHGGGRLEGITNLVEYSVLMTARDEPMPRGELIGGATDLTTEGYVINYGTSFIMTLEYGADGPAAAAFLTYSESSDPSSEHFSDQTLRFSEKNWRPILWHAADIEADTLRLIELSGDPPPR